MGIFLGVIMVSESHSKQDHKAAIAVDQEAPTKPQLHTELKNALSDAEGDWFTDLGLDETASILGVAKQGGKYQKQLGSFRYKTRRDWQQETPPSGTGYHYLELRDRSQVSPFIAKKPGTYAVFLVYAGGRMEYIMDKEQKKGLLGNI